MGALDRDIEGDWEPDDGENIENIAKEIVDYLEY